MAAKWLAAAAEPNIAPRRDGRKFFPYGSKLGILPGMLDDLPEWRARKIDWPNAPPHRLENDGAYFLTASTYLKRRLFHDSARLALLHDRLLTFARRHRWRLEAWAVFSNHYHIVAQSEGAREDLGIMAARLHQKTASELNAMDGATGRKIWQNYRETRLTFERSYLARLNYVHQNPVKHGLAAVANAYPWGTAGWFERTAQGSWIRTVYSFKVDQVKVDDDF